MRILVAPILLLSTLTRVVYGVNAADDVAGQQTALCLSSSSSANSAADGTCSEPVLSEPTNDAILSPAEDEDDDDLHDDAEEEEEEEDEDDDEEDEFEFECTDEDEKCPTYAESGGCTDNPGYMTYHCALSCNTCQAVLDAQKAAEFVAEGTQNTKPCMDDHYSCSEWAGMGECDINPA